MSNNNPGCLGIIFKFFGVMPKTTEDQEEELLEDVLPYKKRDDFLSNAELSFYKILLKAVGNEVVVFPKVSLGDVFFVNIKDRSWKTKYFNKIARKHVDFLICLKDSLNPLCGIELDDTSHTRNDRVERDAFVDKVFDSAELKLFRFENKTGYSIAEIREQIEVVLKNNAKKDLGKNDEIFNVNTLENPSTISEGTDAPVCKKCGIAMILRKAKKGDWKGLEFFGCSNFPQCREVVEVIKDK